MVLPPSLSGTPPMGSSPMAVPTGSPGAQAGALSKLGEALNLLNMALPQLPLGSDVHTKVTQIIQTLVKIAPPQMQQQGVQQSTLQGLMKNAGQNAMLQQVMSSLGAGGAQQQGGGPPSPGAPPPAM